MAPSTVDVNLAAGRKLTLQLEDLKVTGFDPTAGPTADCARRCASSCRTWGSTFR